MCASPGHGAGPRGRAASAHREAVAPPPPRAAPGTLQLIPGTGENLPRARGPHVRGGGWDHRARGPPWWACVLVPVPVGPPVVGVCPGARRPRGGRVSRCPCAPPQRGAPRSPPAAGHSQSPGRPRVGDENRGAALPVRKITKETSARLTISTVISPIKNRPRPPCPGSRVSGSSSWGADREQRDSDESRSAAAGPGRDLLQDRPGPGWGRLLPSGFKAQAASQPPRGGSRCW